MPTNLIRYNLLKTHRALNEKRLSFFMSKFMKINNMCTGEFCLTYFDRDIFLLFTATANLKVY